MGKADGEPTILSFTDDFAEAADGSLMAGGTVRVVYDPDRLTACRGSSNGSEAWSITGWVRFDQAEPIAFAVTRLEGGRVVPVTPELDIPASATTAAFWFSNHNRWGCQAYDSNFGANYTFEIERAGEPSVLAFEADWSESQSAAVRASDGVVLHYAPERLAQCAGTKYGMVAWGITAYWQVDDGPIGTIAVGRSEGTQLVAADPWIDLSAGSELALWFEATSAWGCHAFDSDFGANYRFRIE